MTTIFLLAVFGALIAIQFLVLSGTLWWASARLAAPGSSWRRCAAITLILTALGWLAVFVEKFIEGAPLAILLLLVVGANFFVLARGLRLSLGKAALAWLAIAVASLPMLAVVVLGVQPFLLKSFAQTTGGMSPTILGDHWTGTCPHCGAAAYCAPDLSESGAAASEKLMICERELRAYKIPVTSKKVTLGDRFFVNKLLKPRRWDLVVYRMPADPQTVLVARLVGLPGEMLAIDDGSVLINGERLLPPDEYAGLFYLNRIEEFPSLNLWGAPDSPAELGSDEYFVLGDFSAASRDSRFWEESIDGRAPYALPAANIVGVVTHLYWPLDRWRVFR